MSMSVSTRPVSIVTGAGSGIGAATARLLAQRGDLVVCADVDLASARVVGSEVDGYGVHLDVTSADSCTAMVDEVMAREGRIDHLVHAAGIWEPARAHETAIDSFDRVLDVNLKGSFLVARTVGAAMLGGGGGTVVLIGSVNGVRAGSGQAAYAASKGGVLMLGQVLALEWAERGIRVNVVAPGLTDTAMMVDALPGGSAGGAGVVVDRTPLLRAARPAEIAETIVFLSSDRASYTTGANVVVDGGWLAD